VRVWEPAEIWSGVRAGGAAGAWFGLHAWLCYHWLRPRLPMPGRWCAVRCTGRRTTTTTLSCTRGRGAPTSSRSTCCSRCEPGPRTACLLAAASHAPSAQRHCSGDCTARCGRVWCLQEGPSFTVEGGLVKWQKWQLRVGFNYRWLVKGVRTSGPLHYHPYLCCTITHSQGGPGAAPGGL
jgi:hypothetical protein